MKKMFKAMVNINPYLSIFSSILTIGAVAFYSQYASEGCIYVRGGKACSESIAVTVWLTVVLALLVDLAWVGVLIKEIQKKA